MQIKGLERVLEALRKGEETILRAAEKGLKKAAQHLVARGRAICPEDTRNLVMTIQGTNQVARTSDSMRTEVVALATSDEAGGESYAEKVHENMQYDGPNVGGSRTQGRGPRTLAKGASSVEPSDGTAGGKYLERPLRNKPEQYTEIINATVEGALKG